MDQITHVQAIERLEELKRICDTEQWDGYDAKSLDQRAIDNAKGIIQSLHANTIGPYVYPVPNGNVQLEWEDDKWYIEMEVGSDSVGLFVQENDITQIEEEDCKLSEAINSCAMWLAHFQFDGVVSTKTDPQEHRDWLDSLTDSHR